MTLMEFGYLILISIDFYDFYISVFSLVFVSIEKIYQTLKTVFDHISRHHELRTKILRCASYFQLSSRCLKCGQTRPFVFDILVLIFIVISLIL